MALFKKKLEFPEYLGYWLNGLVNAQSPDIDGADPNKELDEKTREKIIVELRYFTYLLTMLWLSQMQTQGKISKLKPAKISNHEAGKELGFWLIRMLGEVLKQNGMSQKELEAEAQKAGEVINDYVNAIADVPEKELQDKGAFFFACKHFKTRILGKPWGYDKKSAGIGLLVFDIARQVYRNTEVAFKRYNSDVRIA